MQKSFMLPALAAAIGVAWGLDSARAGGSRHAPAHAPAPGLRLDQARRLVLVEIDAPAQLEVAKDLPKSKEGWSTGVTIEALGGVAPAVRAALRKDLAGLAAGAGCPPDQRLAGLLAPHLVEEALGPGWESELGVAGPPDDVLEAALPELAADVKGLVRAKGIRGLEALAFMVSKVAREPRERRDRLFAGLGLGKAVERLAREYPGLVTGRRKGSQRSADPLLGHRVFEALAAVGRKPSPPLRPLGPDLSKQGEDRLSTALWGSASFTAGDFEGASLAGKRLYAGLRGDAGFAALAREGQGVPIAAVDLFGRMDADDDYGRLFEAGLRELSTGPLAEVPRDYRDRYTFVAAACRLLARYHSSGRDGRPVEVEVSCGPLVRRVGRGPGRGLSSRLHLAPTDLAAGAGRVRIVPHGADPVLVRLGFWGE